MFPSLHRSPARDMFLPTPAVSFRLSLIAVGSSQLTQSLIAPLDETRHFTQVIRQQPLRWVLTKMPWSLPAINLAQTK
jgi:hypothetical protein